MTPSLVRATIDLGLLLLPPRLRSLEAVAFLGAIGWQESGWTERWQASRGPARGYFQFEVIGVQGVCDHPATRAMARRVVRACDLGRYWPPHRLPDVRALHEALACHDALAVAMARLLLWQHPASLPRPEDGEPAWTQYVELWRPGRPRPSTWERAWAYGWAIAWMPTATGERLDGEDT